MNNWNNFLNELNKYENNAGITDLKKIIELIKNIEPTEGLHKGYNCLFFKYGNDNKKIQLIYNPIEGNIEITKRIIIDKNTEEIINTKYKIRTSFEMHVTKEEIINHYIKVDGGYQLLIEGEESIESFTESGFQKSKKLKSIYCPHFLFRSEKDRNRCDFIDYAGINYLLKQSDIHFEVLNIEYHLSSINHSIKASENETNNLVVFYKNETNETNETICFPAFFNKDKTIILKPFTTNPLLQYSAVTSSKYEDEEISFDGKTLDDAIAFLNSRYYLGKNILSNEKETYLKKTLDLIKKFNK